jgi:glutamate-1-semialdehyde aminotransferase
MPSELLIQDVTCPRDGSGTPRVFVSGCGAELVDATGARWIDFDNARGSVFLGHGDPAVAEAVCRAATGAAGVATGWNSRLDAILDRLAQLCGGTAVGLYRSGTAAVRATACAVRAVRELPLLLSAGYHGYDPMWAPAADRFTPNPDGVLDTLFDLDVLADALRDPASVAAVVVSPDHLHLGPDWYETVIGLATAAGVPIIADEVKTGLRYRASLSVDWPEQTVWVVAKALANGHPVAAVGGDRALLAPLADSSYTSFFEPTVLAAAEVTLDRISTGDPQRIMAAQGRAFIEAARQEFAAAALPIEIAGDGPMFQFVCADCEVERAFYAAAAKAGLLFYERDNQAPSAAFDAAIVAEAQRQLKEVCASLTGRWTDAEVNASSRYAAAWMVMDGLAGLPRSRAETHAVVDWLEAMSDD